MLFPLNSQVQVRVEGIHKYIKKLGSKPVLFKSVGNGFYAVFFDVFVKRIYKHAFNGHEIPSNVCAFYLSFLLKLLLKIFFFLPILTKVGIRLIDLMINKQQT